MKTRRGVTLLEMMVVMTLIGLLAAVTFPSVAAGVDSLRLRSATNSLVSFLDSALNLADRRQVAVELAISRADNSVWLRAAQSGYERKLELPEGIRVAGVEPGVPNEDGTRRFMLLPGATVPRFSIQIENRRGVRRVLSVDPITGVARVEAEAR